MKKTTTTRRSNRRPTRERKNPSGAQNQLSKRRSNAASKKPGMNTTLEQPITGASETAAVEAPKNSKAEFTRGQLGKAKRAFAKAGQAEASEEVRKKWLAEMKEANVTVMDFTSSRLAKVIKGEIAVSELRKVGIARDCGAAAGLAYGVD
jgi:hypothetical protein